MQIDQLKRDKHQLATEKEELKAEVAGLRDKLGIQKEEDNKENRYSQYESKLATLDLEISLTKNLFKNLTQTIAKGGNPRQK